MDGQIFEKILVFAIGTYFGFMVAALMVANQRGSRRRRDDGDDWDNGTGMA